MHIVTYHSVNARPGLEWVAYIDNGGYLPVRFAGSTEQIAINLAQAEWDKHEPERRAKAERKAKAGTVIATSPIASLLPPVPVSPLAGLLPR